MNYLTEIQNFTCNIYNHDSKTSLIPEADTSEQQENLEEMSPGSTVIFY